MSELNLLLGRFGLMSSTRSVNPKVQVCRLYNPPPQQGILIKRQGISYWQERNWRKEGGEYFGQYVTPHGSWQGKATESISGRVEMYIQHPPDALKRHPHWICFRERGGGWYFIHATTEIPDVSGGILAVEKTITEAYA